MAQAVRHAVLGALDPVTAGELVDLGVASVRQPQHVGEQLEGGVLLRRAGWIANEVPARGEGVAIAPEMGVPATPKLPARSLNVRIAHE